MKMATMTLKGDSPCWKRLLSDKILGDSTDPFFHFGDHHDRLLRFDPKPKHHGRVGAEPIDIPWYLHSLWLYQQKWPALVTIQKSIWPAAFFMGRSSPMRRQDPQIVTWGASRHWSPEAWLTGAERLGERDRLGFFQCNKRWKRLGLCEIFDIWSDEPSTSSVFMCFSWVYPIRPFMFIPTRIQ